MTYDYKYFGPKDTFGQKVKKFFRKVLLTSALVGAVGGTGYHHYGTSEEIVVTVTSVDVTPSGTPGEAPDMVVHTDQGSFNNHPTRLHLKNDADAIDAGQGLQPGAVVRFRVYGFNTQWGNWSLFNRNILNTEVLRAAPMAGPTPPVTPRPQPNRPTAPPPLGTAAPQLSLDVTAEADITLPRACADTRNFAELRANAPQIYRDLAIMERLPLTGRPVFNTVTSARNNIRSCLVPESDNGRGGEYSNHNAQVRRGSGGMTTGHEYFHAQQDMNGGDDASDLLTMRDAAVANALQEASAVAYSLALRQEALNRGLTIAAPQSVTSTVGTTTFTRTFSSAADDSGNQATFTRAYNQSYNQNTSLDGATREARALEAGGRAVVLSLLRGDDGEWIRFYASLIVQNMNNNSQRLSRNNDSVSNYAALRRDAFLKVGKVSDTINFIPAEFLGAGAGQEVERSVGVMGLRMESTTPAASARTAASFRYGRG